MLPRALFLALALTYASADAPDCTTLDPTCSINAFCEGTAAAPFCSCLPGFIDRSAGAGQDCHPNGFAVRYVADFDLSTLLGVASVSELKTLPAAVVMPAFCAVDAQGYFIRATRVGLGYNPHNYTFESSVEVNCLYEAEQPIDPSYAIFSGLVGTERIAPKMYRWVAPSTGSPHDIPPTGMVVDSVHFNPSCADSGCWVIKGTMTTGEAFNSFEVFNTFYLPQADISAESPTGDLSYDFNYDAVEWTFSPANHPCTSVNYAAGDDDFGGLEKISSCCIDYPGEDSNGGFVPNYRPTQAFADWAEKLQCDEKFVTASGEEACWRVYDQHAWWPTAALRCEAAGGYMATIDDEEQNTRMRALLDRHEVDKAWIGARDIRDFQDIGPDFSYLDFVLSQPQFHWVKDDTSVSYDNWAIGEPYNQCTDDSGYFYDYDAAAFEFWYNANCRERDYAVLQADGTWVTAGQKGPIGEKPLPFVCAFEAPTECIAHTIQRPSHSAPSQGDTCLEVHPEYMNWTDAQATCTESGGNLVVLDGLEDHFYLWRMLDHFVLDSSWLGLTDLDTEGTWQWITDDVADDGIHWYSYDEYTFSYVYNYFYDTYSVETESTYYDPENNAVINELRDCAFFDKAGAVWFREECAVLQQFVCEVPRERAVTCHSDIVTATDGAWDIPFPVHYQRFLQGKFKGMGTSPGVTKMENLDPFFGQFAFEIELDEVELRTKAGKLRGTVGVEHTVDTFLGLANFRPTGIQVLDTFAAQTALHLEKTSFFTVSSYGVNDYTFLEYVNLRLVAVYLEDDDFSGADEGGARTVRTSSDVNAAYVQVTFTLGAQYQPNNPTGAGLIPLDSVRAGKGTFFATAEAAGDLEHLCSVYDAAGLGDSVGLAGHEGSRGLFDSRIEQECAPQAAMCASPTSVSDAFVSFNIPLGMDVFAGEESRDMRTQVFVDLVVDALDTSAAGGAPNDGDDPLQMKTTLTASVPIVDGGVNIFCDAFTAKTDLKDVADVDIVVGTASSMLELSRLRIEQDVVSTALSPEAETVIDTVSIESALMTVVLKGNHSYFGGGSSRNTLTYTMELDDLITLHLMEDGEAATTTKQAAVEGLLGTAGDDNDDSNGLLTDGYALNGAFHFTVDRAAGTASLEPTEALLEHCPYNPPRPGAGSSPLETCVLRRDVRARSFPARIGGDPTAIELLAAPTPASSSQASVDAAAAALDAESAESAFLSTVLGGSTYARELAPAFARALHERYDLNGRYRRAFWVNPGYEWTPTQTAGLPIFSVSQKLFLFALVTVDENWTRRRMLLQATPADALQEEGAGLGSTKLSFSVTPKSMFANAFGVPEHKVALFKVELQLTREEACAPAMERQDALRTKLESYLEETASPFHTVQVTAVQVELGGESCAARRSLRRLQSALTSATAAVDMLVVFQEGPESTFNQAAFEELEGVNGVVADSRNDRSVKVDGQYVPPENWNAPGAGEEEKKSGGLDMVLVAALAGCGAALVILGVGFFVLKRRRDNQTEPELVSVISLNDLKTQLEADL